jgi:hypothetical protein
MLFHVGSCIYHFPLSIVLFQVPLTKTMNRRSLYRQRVFNLGLLMAWHPWYEGIIPRDGNEGGDILLVWFCGRWLMGFFLESDENWGREIIVYCKVQLYRPPGLAHLTATQGGVRSVISNGKCAETFQGLREIRVKRRVFTCICRAKYIHIQIAGTRLVNWS